MLSCLSRIRINNSRSLPKLMSESVMPSSHLILCHPFSSCPQSFPASAPGLLHLLFHLLKSPCIVFISHRSSSKSPSLTLCVKLPSLLHYHHCLHPALFYHSNYPTREAHTGPQLLKGKTLTLFCLATRSIIQNSFYHQ